MTRDIYWEGKTNANKLRDRAILKNEFYPMKSAAAIEISEIYFVN
jgi:hypothetical protein